MREPYVSRPNYPLLLAVIAVHALAITYALRPAAFGVLRDRIAPANANAAMPGESSPSRAQAAQATTPQLSSDDPRREFDVQTWVANATRTALRRAQTAYGELEAPLASEPARALDTLRQRYADGDDHANAMRHTLAWECANGHTFYADPQSAPPLERQLDGVAGADQALLRGVYEAGRARWQAIKPRCDLWDAQSDEWRAAAVKYRQGKGANAQFERIDQTFERDASKDPSVLERLLAAIEQLWSRKPDDELARRLAQYMLALDDPATRERGLKLLTALAERDARHAGAVADAYRALYERVQADRAPYDAAQADAWALRAAQAGANAWIAERAGKAAASGDAATAWAWHAYALWLNANGCGVARGTYGEAELAQSLRGIAALDVALASDPRRQAGERYRELVARHGRTALAANGCGPD